MKRLIFLRVLAGGALTLVGLGGSGCRLGGGVGDTVPPPPRDLVRKSFQPKAAAAPARSAPAPR